MRNLCRRHTFNMQGFSLLFHVGPQQSCPLDLSKPQIFVFMDNTGRGSMNIFLAVLKVITNLAGFIKNTSALTNSLLIIWPQEPLFCPGDAMTSKISFHTQITK